MVRCLSVWTCEHELHSHPHISTCTRHVQKVSVPFSFWQSLVWGKTFRLANTVPGCDKYEYIWSQHCSQYMSCYWAGNMAVPFFVLIKEEQRPRVRFISRKCARCWNSHMLMCSVGTMLLLGEVFIWMERNVQETLDVTHRALGMCPNINQSWETRRSQSHGSQEQNSHDPRNFTKTVCQGQEYLAVHKSLGFYKGYKRQIPRQLTEEHKHSHKDICSHDLNIFTVNKTASRTVLSGE